MTAPWRKALGLEILPVQPWAGSNNTSNKLSLLRIPSTPSEPQARVILRIKKNPALHLFGPLCSGHEFKPELLNDLDGVKAYLGGSDGKEPACRHRRPRFDPWVRKILWRRQWQPTPVFLPGESHGQRILAGYNPWGRKESDTTERLTLLLSCTSHPRTYLCYYWKFIPFDHLLIPPAPSHKSDLFLWIFLDSIYKWNHRVFVFLWFI